jgi:hypothetical protein
MGAMAISTLAGARLIVNNPMRLFCSRYFRF